jgi:hypothetical protein
MGESPMRCYFHLVNGHTELIDDDGVEVSNLENAKVQALMAVNELRREYDGAIEDWGGWHLQILCQDGTLLHSFPLVRTMH